MEVCILEKVARYGLGLIFLVMGSNYFLQILPVVQVSL